MKPQHILGKYLGKVGHSVRRPKGILSPVCTQLRWMSCMQWCVWVCVRQALKVKQDVFSGRRPFQSRQIPDNLSKFPPLISASNNSALFVPPTVCSKVGNRRGNLGHSSPRCEQSIPSNSAIHKTPDLNLTSHQAAAVAVVGEKFTTAVLDGSKTHTFGCSAERTGK